MIYIFNNTGESDIEISRNLEMREYSKQIYKFINKPLKQINKDIGNRTAEHFFILKPHNFYYQQKMHTIN